MTAKEYLSQARYLDNRIKSKLLQIDSLNELATRCTPSYSDMPKSPGTVKAQEWNLPFLTSSSWRMKSAKTS